MLKRQAIIAAAFLYLPFASSASGPELVAALSTRISVDGEVLDLKATLAVEAQAVLQGGSRVLNYVCEANGIASIGPDTVPLVGMSMGERRSDAASGAIPMECLVRAGPRQLRVIVEGVIRPDGGVAAVVVRDTQPVL